MGESKKWERPKIDPEMVGHEGAPKFIDADGVSHFTLGGFIAHRLGFCGCGEPEAALDLVMRVLDAIEVSWLAFNAGDHEKGIKIRASLAESFGAHEGIYWLVLYKLDDDGLIEHGTTINCSWLTADGVAALNLLHEWDEERRKGGSK